MFTVRRPLILASGSPRRKDLLHDSGLDMPIITAESLCSPARPFEEPRPVLGESPQGYALRTARAKAAIVATAHPEAIVLAADTIVTIGNNPARILGKPASSDEALSMLQSLAGQTHYVITACCFFWPAADGELSRFDLFAERTAVTFAAWPEATLRAYAQCGEPMDKAGAYAIQGKGSFLVASIEGSWSNVVGLPVVSVLQRLLDGGAIEPVCNGV